MHSPTAMAEQPSHNGYPRGIHFRPKFLWNWLSRLACHVILLETAIKVFVFYPTLVSSFDKEGRIACFAGRIAALLLQTLHRKKVRTKMRPFRSLPIDFTPLKMTARTWILWWDRSQGPSRPVCILFLMICAIFHYLGERFFRKSLS